MTKINWFPGHMNKALRQIESALDGADFVLELRDARAPLASANPLLGQLLRGRKRLIVLNKADLADPRQNDAWAQFYRKQQLETVSTSFAHQQQKNGQKLLRALEQNFGGQKKKGPHGAQWSRAARGLVVGIPNVGKSTLINSLVGQRKLKTEDRAGVTRQLSLVRLNQNYSLFDSPGMLWPDLQDQRAAARLTLMGSLKDQIVEEELLLCFFIQEFEILYPKLLETHYRLAAASLCELREALRAGGQEASAACDESPRAPGILLAGLDPCLLYAALDCLGLRLQCRHRADRMDYRRLLGHLLRDFQRGKLGRISLEHCRVHGR